MSGYVGNPFPMNASIDSERLIDRIYEAGLVPSLWPALLGELGAAIGGVGIAFAGIAAVTADTWLENYRPENILDTRNENGWSPDPAASARILSGVSNQFSVAWYRL